MKHLTLPIFATGLLIATSAQAQTALSSWVINAQLGLAKADASLGKLQSQLPEGEALRSDDQDMMWHIELGYRVTPTLVAQIGYLDMGQADLTISHETPDPEGFQQQVAKVAPVLAKGVTIGLDYTFWQNEMFNVNGQLGGFHWESELASKADGEQLKSDLDGTDPYWGLSFGYKVTTDWNVSIGYQRFHLDPNSVDTLSLGVQFSF